MLLDVREPFEYQISHIEGSKLIPLGQLPQRVNELDTADEIVVYCHTGMRSAQAVRFLNGLGFKKAKNLKGGIRAWTREVDPSLQLVLSGKILKELIFRHAYEPPESARDDKGTWRGSRRTRFTVTITTT